MSCEVFFSLSLMYVELSPKSRLQSLFTFSSTLQSPRMPDTVSVALNREEQSPKIGRIFKKPVLSPQTVFDIIFVYFFYLQSYIISGIRILVRTFNKVFKTQSSKNLIIRRINILSCKNLNRICVVGNYTTQQNERGNRNENFKMK